jgi:glucose uptake protein GlcU
MDLYPWLKLLHIFLAIVAVGFNISYTVWLARASTQPQHLGFALRGVKFMDDRVANPSYAALGLVGIVLVLMRWSFTTPWIIGAIGLYVVLMGVAIAFYTPTLSRQIAVYESAGPEAPEFGALTSRGRALGIFLGVVVLAILVLMVLKPGA